MKLVLPAPLARLIVPRIEASELPVELVLLDDSGRPEGDLSDGEALVRWWYSRRWLAETIAQMPRLRWVHTPSAGVDQVLIPELQTRGLTLTNSAGAQAPSIAEFVLLALLSDAKRFPTLLAAQRRAEWLNDETTQLSELGGKTLLILGYGAIGSAIARRASAFEMRILASRRTPQPDPLVEQVVGEDGWRALLPEADYLVLAAPLTEATRGMLDAAALAALKPGAYLVNIARGELIDDAALVAALREGRIGGALLDAFAHEPLPQDHPYWTLPNCVVTPHISWSSPQVRERTADIFVENLRRFLAGEPLHNVVDYAAGY